MGIPSLATAPLQHWRVLPISMTLSSRQQMTMPMLMDFQDYHSPSTHLIQVMTSPSCYNISQKEALSVTSTQNASTTRKDSTLSTVLPFTKAGWQPMEEDVLKPYQQRSQEIIVKRDCLLWQTRVIIISKYQSQLLRELHQEHPGCSWMNKYNRVQWYCI